MMRIWGALAFFALAACSPAELQVRPAKAKRLAEEFAAVCMSHPRDDEQAKAVAATLDLTVRYVAEQSEAEPKTSVWLNSWADSWSCMLVEGDQGNNVTAHTLTSALGHWKDGQSILWDRPEQRASPKMPLLYFARRQVGADLITLRANRLKGRLVYYMEVSTLP